MQGKISVRDFRVIREADIELSPGVILVSARNGAGKSTVFKAMKALLDGAFGGDENFRHGCDSYSIGIELDGRRLKVERVGKETYLSVDGNPPVSKLGRNPLSKLAPEFPFRRIEYGDDVFYPNFSFQGSVPVFEDISVFDLFSSMFGAVSKVSARIDTLKKERQRKGKALEDTIANIGYVGSQVASTKQWLQDFDKAYPRFDEEYEAVSGRMELLDEFQRLQASVSSFEGQEGFQREHRLFQLADASEEYFPLYEFKVAAAPRAERVRELREAVSDIEARLRSFPQVDSELVSNGARVEELRHEIESLQEALRDNSARREELSQRLEAMVSDEREFRAELDRAMQSGDNGAYLSVLESRFRTQGCPYKELGVCLEQA